MNYDRLLTRVWDKKLKKMLYPDIDYMAITDRYLLICKSILTKEIEVVPFGDRFVPMLCSGWKDGDNKQLIYQDDILDAVYYKNGEHKKITCIVIFDELSCGFQIKELTHNIYDWVQSSLGNTIECKNKIIGNIHENEGA